MENSSLSGDDPRNANGQICRLDAFTEQSAILLRDIERVDPDAMTKLIITRWSTRGFFVRFMNGDTRDCHRAGNLEVASLKNATKNFDGWTVDWDMHLTDEEIGLVQCLMSAATYRCR